MSSSNENEHSAGLRRSTMAGMFWMISQSFGAKIIGVAGQIVLAYLLMPEHYALISLTYTVTAFARVFESGGLRDVLLQRGSKQFGNSAFWLALTLGLFSGVLIAVFAPVATWIYDSDKVKYLLFSLAFSPLILAASTVSVVQLQEQHRFRTLALLSAFQALSQTVITVAAAAMGLGAFSFVLGTVLSSLAYTIAVVIASPFHFSFQWKLSDCRYLYRDSIVLSLVALVTTIIQQVDYILLGIFQTKQEVGYYFFAYSMATQVTQVLGANMTTVFLPVLCKLQFDPSRQLAGSLDAFRLVAAAGFPVAFLQCALSDSGFHLFLPSKWDAAIPLSQVLSLGLGLNILSGLCWSLLKARGRYRTILALTSLFAVLFTAVVALSAWKGNALAVSWCVFLLCALYSPAVLWFSISAIGGTLRDVVSVFAFPLMGSSACLLTSMFMDNYLLVGCSYVLRFAVVCLVFCGVYLLCLWLVDHPLQREIVRFRQSFWMKLRSAISH